MITRWTPRHVRVDRDFSCWICLSFVRSLLVRWNVHTFWLLFSFAQMHISSSTCVMIRAQTLVVYFAEEDLEGKTEEEIEMMKLMGFASFDSTKVSKAQSRWRARVGFPSPVRVPHSFATTSNFCQRHSRFVAQSLRGMSTCRGSSTAAFRGCPAQRGPGFKGV